MPRLSVVMPAYNEADNIGLALAEIAACVLHTVDDAEVVVIDDGSRDDTAARVTALASDDPRLRLIRQANAGHGPALLRGLREARGEWLLLLDSDRQIGLDRFAETWSLAATVPAVFGVRMIRHDPLHRHWVSKGLRALVTVLFGRTTGDLNVPYKLLHRSVVEAALPLLDDDCLIPSALLAAFVLQRELPFREHPIEHRPRVAGETVLKPWRLARFCARASLHLWSFHRRLRQP